MKFKEKLKEEKPREKLKKLGITSLSNSELISILLRTGNKKESVEELSTRILKEIGGIHKINSLSLNMLTKINGIGISKASTILVAVELGKRILTNSSKKIKLNNTINIFNYYKNDFINEKQEKFFVLLYDSKYNLIEKKEIYKGNIDSIGEVHPREIFKEAIKESATSIIIMHNHPSGDVTPSKEDIETTDRIIEAGILLGIEILDHIIISSKTYYSFYENRIKEKTIHKL